jgi:hypothetical protein
LPIFIRGTLNNVSSMGAYPPPADAGGGTGLSAPIFGSTLPGGTKGFPLQSLARKTWRYAPLRQLRPRIKKFPDRNGLKGPHPAVSGHSALVGRDQAFRSIFICF